MRKEKTVMILLAVLAVIATECKVEAEAIL